MYTYTHGRNRKGSDRVDGRARRTVGGVKKRNKDGKTGDLVSVGSGVP